MVVKTENSSLYEYRIAGIPTSEVPPEIKHMAIIDGVKKLQIGQFRDPKALDLKKISFKVTEICVPGFPISFRWTLQRLNNNPGLRDEKIMSPCNYVTADDTMGIGCPFSQTKTGQPEIKLIAQVMAPIMVLAIDAYRMDVEPQTLYQYDIEGKKLENLRLYRWKIGGVTPISFYDDRLCRSAFGIDANEVAKRVSGAVPYVQVIPLRNRNGVLIQAVDDYVQMEEFLPVRERIMAAITGTKSGA